MLSHEMEAEETELIWLRHLWGRRGAIYEQRMLNDTDLFLLTQSD